MKSIQEETDVIIIPYQVLEAIADGKIILKSTAKAQMFPFGFATVTAEELENIRIGRYLYDPLHWAEKHHINKGYSKDA